MTASITLLFTALNSASAATSFLFSARARRFQLTPCSPPSPSTDPSMLPRPSASSASSSSSHAPAPAPASLRASTGSGAKKSPDGTGGRPPPLAPCSDERDDGRLREPGVADMGVSWGRAGPLAAAAAAAEVVSPPFTSTLGGGGGGGGGGVASRTGRPVLCGTCNESFDGRRPSDEADAAEVGSALAAVAESGVAVVGVGDSVARTPGAGAMGREGKVE